MAGKLGNSSLIVGYTCCATNNTWFILAALTSGWVTSWKCNMTKSKIYISQSHIVMKYVHIEPMTIYHASFSFSLLCA
jgi:hypothetical protein